MGSLHTFMGDTTDHAELTRKKASGEDWTAQLRPTDVMMIPAACYPLVPDRGGHAEPNRAGPSICGRSCSATSPRPIRRGCRSSGSANTCGSAPPQQALAHRDYWLQARRRNAACRRASGTARGGQRSVFRRGGRVMAATQREQTLKYELVRADRVRRQADGHRILQLSPRTLRPDVRHQDARRTATRTPRASASAWSASLWPCSRHTASTSSRGRLRSVRCWLCETTGAVARSRRPTSVTRSTRTNGIWAETNCYVDVWIELLHALRLRAGGGLPFTLAIDFEGDQWTFFKFPLMDLHRRCSALTSRSSRSGAARAHIEEQVGRGRPVLVELDSFYLPDTAGTAYQRRTRQIDRCRRGHRCRGRPSGLLPRPGVLQPRW